MSAIHTYVVAGPKGIILGDRLYKAGEDINLTEEQAAQVADRIEQQIKPRAVAPETPEAAEAQARKDATTIEEAKDVKVIDEKPMRHQYEPMDKAKKDR